MAKIFAALDTKDLQRALQFCDDIKGTPELGVKLGLEFVHACGHDAVKKITATGLDVFLDLKFHDIPNTVARASEALVELGVKVINVHASGGSAMMKAAREAVHNRAAKLAVPPPHLIAVTVLTSLSEEALSEVGQSGPIEDHVVRLAQLTEASGLDGVVCAGTDLEGISQACSPRFLKVVPGIRLEDQNHDDQKRVMTPQQAMSRGASALVIGRAITNSSNPAETATKILQELDAAGAI